MKIKFFTHFLKKFSLTFFCFTILINVVGELRAPVVNQDIAKVSVIGYDTRKVEVGFAIKKATQLLKSDEGQESKAEKILDLIFSSYIHTPKAYKLSPLDNWLMWINNLRYKSTYDKEPTHGKQLWKRGGGFCHQASIIFIEMMKKCDVKGKLIGLHGHMVSQVYLDSKWRCADADMGGILYSFSFEDLKNKTLHPKIKEEIFKKMTEKGFSENAAKANIGLFLSYENNRIRNYPSAVQKSRYSIEAYSNTLKWGIPFVALALSLGLHFFENQRPRFRHHH